MTNTKRIAGALAALAMALGAAAGAHEGNVPSGVPQLDHVFLIMMENHGYGQVVNNPSEPYMNALIADGKVSVATNYFAVGHPSLTNYLEIVGGSNFGVRSDNNPDWHDTACQTNLASGIIDADNAASISVLTVTNSKGQAVSYSVGGGAVCPISGSGADAVTEAVDNWNEVSKISPAGVTPAVFNHLADFDGVMALDQASDIHGKTIADQLVRAGRDWKSYQESLPLAGADNVGFSNGTVTDLTDLSAPIWANLPASPGSYVKLYAAKHNPFVYFKSVQENTEPGLGLGNVVPFDGTHGLYADLATGSVPAYSFIVPNQCNDQHGRSNGDSFCELDLSDDGTQNGLNPGLIAQGDSTIERLVASIKASPAWRDGKNAIVIVWDENDYSGVNTAPPAGQKFPPQNQNRVLLTVETSYRSSPVVQSNRHYNHFSLLRTIEAALGLPCLNHACDKDAAVMADLFAR
ncbi:Phosphoesterase [Burkholderiales bacterium]|nr:Phosphoesterase [Burkholderiales bacterium]